MKCPICGSNNRSGIRFCKYCGSPLGNPEDDLPNDSSLTTQTIPVPVEKKIDETAAPPIVHEKSKKFPVILTTVIAAAVSVIAVFVILMATGVLRFAGNSGSPASIATTVAVAATETASESTTTVPPATEAKLVNVPDVVGMNRSDAITAVSNAGFTISVQESENTDVAKDFVISQSPVSGRSVEAGSMVTIYVSAKKEAVVSRVQSSASSSNTKYLYCCASEFATLRKGASRSSDEIVKITTREQVEYLGKDGEFYYVSYKGKKGYVLADFFSEDINAPLNYGTGNL